MRLLLITALTALALLSTVPPSLADPTGDQRRIAVEDGDPSSEDADSSVIAAGRGSSLVVWEKQTSFEFGGTRGDTSAFDQAYGRFVDPSGAPLGDEFAIAESGFAAQFDLDVAYDATRDEYLVVWVEEPVNDGRGRPAQGVRGRRVRPDGSFNGSAFQIGGDEPRMTSVAWNDDEDSYLVVWSDEDNDDRITGRRVGGDGSLLDDGEQVFTGNDKFAPSDPDVAHDTTTNRWLLVFDAGSDEEGRGPIIEAGVFGILLDRLAEPETDPFRVDVVPDDTRQRNKDAVVAANTTRGGFVVAYEGDDNDREEIFARAVDASGATPTDPMQLSSADDDEDRASTDPEIARDPRADEFLVVWTQDMDDDGESENEVFGQRFTGAGAKVGTSPARVSVQGADGDDQFDGDDPTVAYSASSCQYTVTWTGELGEEADDSIFDRAFDAPDCPVEEKKADPPAATQQAASTAVVAAVPRRCLSRRRFPINLRARRGQRFTSVTATVDGTAVAAEPGRRVRILVDLRGKDPGTYTVRVRARLSTGRVVLVTRRYRTCVRPSLSRKPPARG